MIYIKTELGKTALHDKSLGLTPKQRSSFIMFDGKRTLDDIFKLTSALGVTAEDIDRLVTLGLLAPAAGVTNSSTASSAPVAAAQSLDDTAPKSSVPPALDKVLLPTTRLTMPRLT